MVTEKTMKRKIDPKSELIAELKQLFLKETGTELCERGLYFRIVPNIANLGGSFDKTTAELARVRDIIISLSE